MESRSKLRILDRSLSPPLRRFARPGEAGTGSRAGLLRAELEQARVGLVPNSFGPIVSVLAGPSERALAAAHTLRDQGILVQPIRPPTVPAGLARLRLTLSASFAEQDVRRLAAAVGALLGEP
jgi:7-keto-8-aminopelargonate synthetase-like enzyme